MNSNIGFIGMGNMASAIATGFVVSGFVDRKNMYAYDILQDKLRANAERIGYIPCENMKELCEKSDILIMACRPFQIKEILQEIAEDLKGKALLSIAAGWDFKMYYDILGENTRIQTIMPNTPAMVGEGVFLFEKENSFKSDERKEVMDLFSAIGMVQELPSNLMGIGTAITGCGPAFIDMLMEGFGDAAVKYGMQRDMAYRLIAQMVMGSARLQLDTKKHPGVLKDEVCSPGGTTIRGVEALEKAGFRAACMDAVKAVIEADI